MKFNVKLRKLLVFKPSYQQLLQKQSTSKLLVINNEAKRSKTAFHSFPMKRLIFHKKRQKSINKLPSVTRLYTEQFQNESKDTIREKNNCFEKENTKQSTKTCVYSSLNSQTIHVASSRTVLEELNGSTRLLIRSLTCKNNEDIDGSTKSLLETINNRNDSSSKLFTKSDVFLNKPYSFKSQSKDSQQHHESAIIEIAHLSYNSRLSSINLNKPLEKSYSLPLPRNRNYSCMNDKNIQSADHIDPYEKYNNESSLYSSTDDNDIDTNQSTQNVPSSNRNNNNNLLEYEHNINKKLIGKRWSLFNVWKTAIDKLPPILHSIWRQQLYRTGSREFLLEHDQTLPLNDSINNNQTRFAHEQRYVEQERSINTHFGLALLALLIFPPIGILSIILSIWSTFGHQDRHLSRKLGNGAYWTSLLAICFSFLLLFTLFTYFTYQYFIYRQLLST